MGLGSVFIKSKYNKSEEQLIKISLHELHHAQGGGFACVPDVSKKIPHNVNRDLKTQLGHGFKLGHPPLTYMMCLIALS